MLDLLLSPLAYLSRMGPGQSLWLLAVFFGHVLLVWLFVRSVLRARGSLVRSLVGVPHGVG